MNEQLQRLIVSLIDAIAVTAPSRLVSLCREILESRELRKPKQGSEAFSGPTGDEGKLRYADEEVDEDDAKQQQAQNEEEDGAIKVGKKRTLTISVLTKFQERGSDVHAFFDDQKILFEQCDSCCNNSARSPGTFRFKAGKSGESKEPESRFLGVQFERTRQYGFKSGRQLGQLTEKRRWFLFFCGIFS